MRALTQRSGLEYCREYPAPTPADGEAVVRVIQAGICATDLQLVQGYMGFQGVLGHEFVGIVDEAPTIRTWSESGSSAKSTRPAGSVRSVKPDA